jgi:CheY-like chemotaxis protein
MGINAEKVKILVVDDAALIRSIIAFNVLSAFSNVVIEEAADGLAAQKKMLTSKYDMIISDWEMPNLSGIDLLQWIRSHPDLEKTPFVLVTGNAEQENVIKAIKLGVSAYITKPFTGRELTIKLSGVLDVFQEGSGI